MYRYMNCADISESGVTEFVSLLLINVPLAENPANKMLRLLRTMCCVISAML
jgi:hypothetical protein